MAAAGLDCGGVMQAERGTLRWRITVRPDGRRMAGGAVPALIEWGGAHPTDALPPSGVRLESLNVRAPAIAGLLPPGVVAAAPVPISAVLTTANGSVAPSVSRLSD